MLTDSLTNSLQQYAIGFPLCWDQWKNLRFCTSWSFPACGTWEVHTDRLNIACSERWFLYFFFQKSSLPPRTYKNVWKHSLHFKMLTGVWDALPLYFSVKFIILYSLSREQRKNEVLLQNQNKQTNKNSYHLGNTIQFPLCISDLLLLFPSLTFMKHLLCARNCWAFHVRYVNSHHRPVW